MDRRYGVLLYPVARRVPNALVWPDRQKGKSRDDAWRIAAMQLLRCWHAQDEVLKAFPARTSLRMSIVGDAVTDKVDGQLQAHLGGCLKAVYQTVVEESLPERLLDLLDALDRRGDEVEATKQRMTSALEVNAAAKIAKVSR